MYDMIRMCLGHRQELRECDHREYHSTIAPLLKNLLILRGYMKDGRNDFLMDMGLFEGVRLDSAFELM